MNERVKGSGKITSESREVGEVRGIDLSAGGVAEVTVGHSENLEITTDDNLLPYIETEVRNGILEIRVRQGAAITPSKDVRYHIQVRTLESLDVTGSGEMSLNELSGDRLAVDSSGMGRFTLHKLELQTLSIDVSGTGSVTTDGQAETLDLQLSGSGEFSGADLRTQKARVDISGAGKAVLWVVERLGVEISGAGVVWYYGNPHVMKDISGAGMVKGLGEK